MQDTAKFQLVSRVIYQCFIYNQALAAKRPVCK